MLKNLASIVCKKAIAVKNKKVAECILEDKKIVIKGRKDIVEKMGENIRSMLIEEKWVPKKNYNATTASIGTTLSIKNLNNLIDEFKKLEKNNFSIVEARFKKVPNVINKFERKTFAKEIRLLDCLHGIPIVIDKKVPLDEYWLKDNNGKISKFKI